ncbi:MAG TPA: metalloregulator ArsR/SmtB family transcription factor [Candidatus Limnocylindrales bacterium]|nr:metalloregulator ArsR/SmtB family transcription factor [Candidatus Limnocylindrales bacterium]
MSARTSSNASTNAPGGRAMVRDIGSGASLPTTFDVRTAYDFAISLSSDVGEHDELPAEDRRWLERARASLPESVRQTITEETCVHGTGLIVDRPEVTDAAGVVALLERTPGKEFAKVVLGGSLHDTAGQAEVDAALDGDREATSALLAAWPDHKQDWLMRLIDDADELVGGVAALMRAWLPLYQEIEPRVREIITRDVDLRAGDIATLRPAELIERTTNGIRWLSEPGVRRIVLAPSYLVRPYNFTFSGGDWRMFVYPVADEATEPHDPLAPPQTVLRLHRALGDDTRLRILRLLKDRDWYLTEIAERLELSKPTIKHHLAQLRAAGLVTLTEEGGLSYYSLRRDRLQDATAELVRFLT